MDNFQYSVQLSDQDWAEFSATADECGLLQAGLASGDELLSSDIDQGDSSGSSPPRPPPLLTGQLAPRGRGWRRCEEEEDVATLQLVSRSQCESVLALGAGQQVAGTSAQFPGSGGAPPSQLSVLPGSAASTEEMQRLLQGPAPSPPGEPPQSSESPGLSPTSQKPPDSPGAPARSPGRKKRRTVGAKGGGRSGAPGPAAAQLGSLLPTEATREEGIRLAGPKGKGLVTGAAQLTAGPRPDSAGPPEHVARQGLGLDLSTSSPRIEQGTEQTRMTSRAELHMAPMSGQEAHPDVMASPDLALSTPACKPQPNMGLCTPDSEPQPDLGLSTPASKPQSDMASSISASKTELNVAFSTPASEPPPNQGLSIPASEPQPNVALSMPACKPQSDVALSTLASEPPPNMVLSTPAFKPQRDMALSTPASEPQCAQTGSTPASTPSLRVDLHAVEVNSSAPVSVAQPYTALPHTASKAASDAGVPAPGTSAAEPSQDPVPQAGSDTVGTEVVMPPGGPQEKPREQHSAVAPGSPEGEPPPGPMQAPKRKKVRFSMAEPSPKELGEAEAEGPPSPVMAQPSALKMATGGRGGSAAWDAVAIGPRPPQPRILKHLPPPALSASVGTGSSFAVTLPEAYEFFFCDTIEEEDEGDGEEATSQVLGEVQWPDTCEFFFRDCQAQRPRRQGCYSPAAAPHLRSQPAPAAAPGDFVPISIPEAYEHFLGEDRLEGVLPSAALLQTRASEAPQEGGSRTPSEPSLATVEQLSLAVRWAGDLCSPLTTSTFSQNDMCLVFVAFATWAVRTSDLHTPDAWKTVLLANIGTISAIRYFRRRVRRGRSPSRSCSRSPSPSS